MSSYHRVNQRRLQQLLRGPNGAVATDLLRRGARVVNRAKLLLTGRGSRHPARVDTGRLRSDVGVRLIYVRRSPVARVGTGIRYSIWIHDGTGIYGPRRTRIVPRTKRALSFRVAGGGRVTVRSVRGIRPNNFLSAALEAAGRAT